jgi:NAD(P)H-dependent FMN reductase
MKILSFAATNNQQSINKQLVTHATEVLAERIGTDAEVEIIDLNDYEMPIYSIDRENEAGVPAEAHRFFNQVREADVVLISFAEHNGSYTAAYKNLYDWASRINMRVYDNKPMLLLATSPGPGGAGNVLRAAAETLPHFGADVRGRFALAQFHDHFDLEAGRLSNPTLIAELIGQLDTLVAAGPVAA